MFIEITRSVGLNGGDAWVGERYEVKDHVGRYLVATDRAVEVDSLEAAPKVPNKVITVNDSLSEATKRGPGRPRKEAK